jgi:hypothetical protein
MCAGLLVLAAAVVLVGAPPASPPPQKSPQELLKVSLKRPAVRSTLAQAIVDLGTLAGAKIVVDWQGLMDAGVKPEAPVALAATESTLEKLLEQTLSSVATRGHPLAWQAIDGSLVVTTQARVLRKDIRLADNGAATSRPSGAPGMVADAVGVDADAGGVRFKFDKTPLSGVIEFLRKVTSKDKVNFHVNYTALETSGITADTPVTMNVGNITVMKALDMLCEQLSGAKSKFDSVYWVVDEGVVQITTGTALDSKTMTRQYDMADMLMPVPDALGPRMNLSLQTSSNGTGTGGSGNGSLMGTGTGTVQTVVTSGTQVREEMQKKLITMIQNSIGDDMWQEKGGKGNISFLRNTMIISQTKLGFLLLDRAHVLR